MKRFALYLMAVFFLSACKEYRLPFLDTQGKLWMGYWVKEPALNKPLTLVAAQRLFSTTDETMGIWPDRVGTHSDGCLIDWASPSDAVLCPAQFEEVGFNIIWAPGQGPVVAIPLFYLVE